MRIHIHLMLNLFTLLFGHASLAAVFLTRPLPLPAPPLKPSYHYNYKDNTVPAFPAQMDDAQSCRLDLSSQLFGGVSAACTRDLDRDRCCPVLAAWLFSAHARSALQVSATPPPAASDLPMMPDDSQKCVDSLQRSLASRHIHIPQPNASCDAILCFCGIRLHTITSLSCPAVFTITGNDGKAMPTAAVRELENNCDDSSYAGCTKCLGALRKLKVEMKKGTEEEESERGSKMLSRDCQLMGLTWLLTRNRTAYIATVSAVLRAIMYSSHPPHGWTCSPDQENMPLALDYMQMQYQYDSSFSASTVPIPLLPLIILPFLFLVCLGPSLS